MNMFDRIFCKKEIYGASSEMPSNAEEIVAAPKGLVFKGGEPTITPIKIYHDDYYVGSITKSNDEFVFGSYVCINLNYNTCARIAEKLKELNGQDHHS